jgi:hypothetical protein
MGSEIALVEKMIEGQKFFATCELVANLRFAVFAHGISGCFVLFLPQRKEGLRLWNVEGWPFVSKCDAPSQLNDRLHGSIQTGSSS